ncbi:MAG: hypothetical protein WBZ28_09485 [Pseudolabrys sp.]
MLFNLEQVREFLVMKMAADEDAEILRLMRLAIEKSRGYASYWKWKIDKRQADSHFHAFGRFPRNFTTTREVSRVKSFFSHAPINGGGRLNFQTAAYAKCASSSGGSQGLGCLLLALSVIRRDAPYCPPLDNSGQSRILARMFCLLLT